MEDEDNLELLFQQKINDGLFDMKDEKLQKLKLKAKEAQKNFIEFINTIISRDETEKLKELLEIRDDAYNDCFYLENCLYYKQGINDGFSMVLTSLKSKVDYSD